MQLNRRLNLLLPIEQDRGTTYVHSIPISKEVFEQNFMLFARTNSAMVALGIDDPVTAPRIAGMMLKKTGKDLGLEREVESLMQEIRRLSNVAVPTDAGYEVIGLDGALQRKLFDEDDVSEVENVIVFFTVVSWMHKKSGLVAFLGEGLKIWNAQLTSFTCTEYANSLMTSTQAESSGEKKEQAGLSPPR
jgi:hypothetical protein